MPIFLLATAGFILWSITIILIYYSTFYSRVNHIESASGFGAYLLTTVLLYGVYKVWTILSEQKTIRFDAKNILILFVLHLFILSGIYSHLPEVVGSPFLDGVKPTTFGLFFHILKLLFYPTLLVLIFRSVGFSILSYCMNFWRDMDARIRIPGEILFGLFLFSVALLIAGSMGQYHLTSLLIILSVLSIAGIPWFRETYSDMKHRAIIYENHTSHSSFWKSLQLPLLSTEFAIFFLLFLSGVSLINVIRPMPIGWDDLGVYMNFPKLMSLSQSLLPWAGLYTWQLITGTGFFFDYNASQAFYVNQIGGFLSVFFLISILSYIFEEKWKKSLLALPILLAAYYYAMPMTVFEQAKDMKLDPTYFASIISGFALVYAYFHEQSHRGTRYGILLVAGVIVGLSFTIKVTSIMLILGILGMIAYRTLSFWWYSGFFFLFLAIFTQGNLWSIMNIPMPKNDPSLIAWVSAFLGILSLASFAIGFLFGQQKKNENHALAWIRQSLIFVLWVGIAVMPWIIKNISENIHEHAQITSINAIIWGRAPQSPYQFSSIYTPSEIKEIEKKASVTMNASGKSENEDLGRYFWYESGLNNYLKLPANLTFQQNQAGEFTEIGFLFLALVPWLMLFVGRRRRHYFTLGGLVMIAFMVLYYFIGPTRDHISQFFARFTIMPERENILSYGYLVLITLSLGVVAYFHRFQEKSSESEKIMDIIVFMGIYGFLFVIATFGIVWYGIMIYFSYFVMVGLFAASFTHYDESEEKDEEKMSIFLTLSVVLFIFIAVYFVRSVFPHGWNNLKSAYYNEYKYNVLSQEESIFAYRSDYLLPIAVMNLKDPSELLAKLRANTQTVEIQKLIDSLPKDASSLGELHSLINRYRSNAPTELKTALRNLGEDMYNNILYPDANNTNTWGIYRIGTFMTYLIHKNTTRYFDDSLVMNFRDYFYDPSPEKTIERMKKMGLRYLLIDLNAATIDRDPRHNLTDRFEKLLLTTNASNLRLVSTDNSCLELAINERKKGKITTDQEFIDIAGTNYESYRSGSVISRGQKLYQCQNYVIWLINSGRANEYSLVKAIQDEIISQNATKNPNLMGQILSRSLGQSWFALFEITDAPPVKSSQQNPSLSATGSVLSRSTNSGETNSPPMSE